MENTEGNTQSVNSNSTPTPGASKRTKRTQQKPSKSEALQILTSTLKMCSDAGITVRMGNSRLDQVGGPVDLVKIAIFGATLDQSDPDRKTLKEA